MTEWTPKYRLQLIKTLVAKNYDRPLSQAQIKDLLYRISLLCTAMDGFLEANKANYEDAIEIVRDEQ